MESKKLNHSWRKAKATNTAEQKGSGLFSRIQPSIGASSYANHNKHQKWGQPPPNYKFKLNFDAAFSQIWDAQACESLYEMKREKSWELCQQEEPGLMTVWK